MLKEDKERLSLRPAKVVVQRNVDEEEEIELFLLLSETVQFAWNVKRLQNLGDVLMLASPVRDQ